jgi:glycosyltransferase involved in cell wall biosynthesis
MKVAIVVVQFPPKWLAGTEIATYNIAKHLSRRDHEIHVITKSDPDTARLTKKDGFSIHRVKFPDIRFIGVLIFWLGVFRCLKRIDPQIIHTQMIDMGVPGFFAKKFLNKPFIVYCRGSDVYRHWQLKKFISKLVFSNASKIITLTQDMQEEVGDNYKDDVVVIPNGIDLEKFENFPNDRAAHDNHTILFVGTLRLVKGVRYLIEAMKIVVKRIPNSRLVIVGDGGETVNLQTLIKKGRLAEHVTFVGKVPNEDIPKYMSSSDIFVLPSLSEGFPNVILEAMASGLPIVCSDVGGMKEIVKDGENGFTVPPKNIDKLSDNIIKLLEDDLLRQAVSKTNKQTVIMYTWENVVKRIEEIYESCLLDGQPPIDGKQTAQGNL